jgi:hypothetical protein
LPHAQEVDPVEAAGEAIELGVGEVVEGRRPAERLADLVEPRASVDLVERRESTQREPPGFQKLSSIDSALPMPK